MAKNQGHGRLNYENPAHAFATNRVSSWDCCQCDEWMTQENDRNEIYWMCAICDTGNDYWIAPAK